ncbi:MAG: phosphoglucosamine mutase [Armatimonadota bacterium]
MEALFGTDGVRGLANVELTVEIATALGAAAARQVPSSAHFVIGTDTRRSAGLLQCAFAAGAMSQGRDVWSVGVISTPGVSFLTRTTGAAAGVVISASHNPAPDNGIKFFGADGCKLPDALEELIADECRVWHTRPRVSGHAIGRLIDASHATSEYRSELLESMSGDRLDGLRIVIDCANGAAWQIAPAIFESLGATIQCIGVTPDGDNINAGCGSTHTSQLVEVVQSIAFDLGISFDGDADRVLLCDNRGRILTGDHQILMNAELSKFHDGKRVDAVVGTVMSNLGLDDRLRKSDIKLLRSAVGDRNVAELMRQSGATIGGEPSGHILLHHISPAGDGILAALQCLRILKRTGTTVANWIDEIVPYPQRLLNLRVTDKYAWESSSAVQSVIADAEAALDGNGRILVRASGTEPTVRVMVEARSQDQVDHWVERVADAIRKAGSSNS